MLRRFILLYVIILSYVIIFYLGIPPQTPNLLKYAQNPESYKQNNLKFEFSTSNGRGREIEYYTSFIFSIDIKIKNKQKTLISGGRYNDLTSKNLGLRKIPAVGAAINLDKI